MRGERPVASLPVKTASTNDDTAVQRRANRSTGASRTRRAPLIIRPWLLFLLSLVGFAANWWSGVFQPQGLTMLGVACGKTALRTQILTDVVLGIYALAGLIIALAVVRCFWRRVTLTSSLFAVIMVPVVIGCALLNVWLAYTTQYEYLNLIVTCAP